MARMFRSILGFTMDARGVAGSCSIGFCVRGPSRGSEQGGATNVYSITKETTVARYLDTQSVYPPPHQSARRA